MNDSQILSVLASSSPPAAARPALALVFDACHMGVVLRAVLFVEAALAVAVMFGAATFADWLGRLAVCTAAALPGTLAWLLLGCLGKRWLAHWSVTAQGVAGAALGAVCGLYGCAMLAVAGVVEPAPWVASAFAGAVLASVLVAALVMRARARTPADTAARLAELQSRIRPHFLFNTLNSAIALVRAEPARAERLLEDLSDLFRFALKEQGESVTLAEEIALARRYLAIEEVRFGARLQVRWTLDPAADGARLPPLLLQPLVENAVRHGVEPSAEGAVVHITTQRRGAVVVIKVSNTLPAGPGAAGAGLALANVRQRLSLLHDVQAQLRTRLHKGEFQVRMEVPA